MCHFLRDLLVAKRIQISLFHSDDLRADFNNAVQTVARLRTQLIKEKLKRVYAAVASENVIKNLFS